jgi:RND superfamily putative drug exporter
MTSFLRRLGDWCGRHGLIVLALWVALAGAVLGGMAVFGAPVNNDVTIPESDAQIAHDLLREQFDPADGGGRTAQLVLYSADRALTDKAPKKAVEAALEEIRALPRVVSVETPYRYGGISSSLRIGMITVRMESDGGGTGASGSPTVDELVRAAAPAAEAGIEVVPVDTSSPADKEIKTSTSEIIGVSIALLVLLFAFGTLVAAMIPIFTALFSVAVGLGVIGLLGHVIDVPSQASVMATMIGIGVGIDYALFLISRHRRLLADGVPVRESIARTTAGSGGAVLFAGGTVVIALSALFLAGFPLLRTLGLLTGVSVVCAVLTSLTLVPALLGLLGHRVNALRIPLVGPRRTGRDGPATGWAALGDWVAARPWRVLAASVLVLGALTAPMLGLKLGTLDDGYAGEGTSARRAYELMTTGFGPGSIAPMLVVAELDHKVEAAADDKTGADDAKDAKDGKGAGGKDAKGDDLAALGAEEKASHPDPTVRELVERVEAVDGVTHVTKPVIGEDGDVVMVSAVSRFAPSDDRAVDVVKRIRALTVPGAELHVGGEVAGLADAGERISSRTPLVIAVVVLLSALLLLLAFRAPLLAVKAAVMNLVSLGAAFGALAVVFSYGVGSMLVGMDPPPSADGSPVEVLFFTVPIDDYVPVMLFAVLFGLSMDYEVFLLTSVRQAYLRSGDNRAAVAEGLGSTGRVITSAALIMVAVFVAFIAYPDPLVKVFGVGLAVAIAVDATLIRGFLVPATMVLLGRYNWWCPRWLDRILPPLSVAEHADDEDLEPASRELVGAGRGPGA